MKVSETIQYKLVESRIKYKDRYTPNELEDFNNLLDLVKDLEVVENGSRGSD